MMQENEEIDDITTQLCENDHAVKTGSESEIFGVITPCIYQYLVRGVGNNLIELV